MKKFAAVIGYGGMGSWHVQHLQNSDTWQLAGVYDIDPARMELAKSRGIPTYRTEQELLEDPQVEEVTIAIPNDQHLPVFIHDCITNSRYSFFLIRPICNLIANFYIF